MKRSRQMFYQMAIAICSLLFSFSANAASFTAITSGAFSATTTWAGGVVPTLPLPGTDDITISAGVTVTLDQNLVITNVGSTLTLFGRIAPASSPKYFVMTAGTLAGTGSINVDSMAIGGSVINLSTSGHDTAQKFTSLGFNVSSGTNFYVGQTLYVNAGTFSLNSGSLNLGSNATIIVNGGSFATSGIGVFNTPATSYNVIYTGSSATTSAELTGGGLGKVTVAVPASSTVTLFTNVTIQDTLTLTSGELILNNNNLTFSGNGNISASGTGTINSTNGSNITLNSNNNFAGGLRFSTGGNTVNNLIVNMGSSSVSANLASDLNVDGQFILQMGKLVSANKLTVAQGGSITGGVSGSYYVTTGAGSLAAYIAAGDSVAFPIGTTANMAPAIVVANSSSASGTVTVSVSPTVYVAGTSGASLSTTESIVDATWLISSSATTGINYKLYLAWNAGMEINGFDRTKAYIAHYTAGAWDKVAVSAALSIGAGMYAMSRDNITSLSPFAVADANASMTSVPVISQDKSITLYPNPATNTLSFKSPVSIDRIDVYNIMGRLVQSTAVGSSNSISLEALPSGLYNAYLYSKESASVQKFVKE